jgi:hypothetical protein
VCSSDLASLVSEKKRFECSVSKIVDGIGFAEIIFGFCFDVVCCASRAARYLFPLVALHLRQAGTRLLNSDVPFRSVSMR